MAQRVTREDLQPGDRVRLVFFRSGLVSQPEQAWHERVVRLTRTRAILRCGSWVDAHGEVLPRTQDGCVWAERPS